MSYFEKRVGSAAQDMRKMSRARVLKPQRWVSFVGKVPFQRRSPQESGAIWIRTRYLRVGLRRRGARKTKWCTLECGGREAFSRPAYQAGVGCPDGACRLAAMERAKWLHARVQRARGLCEGPA